MNKQLKFFEVDFFINKTLSKRRIFGVVALGVFKLNSRQNGGSSYKLQIE